MKVDFPAPTAGKAFGLALQNTSGADATVTLRLVNGAAPAAPITFSLLENARLSASLGEAFGTSCSVACTLRVTSSRGVQVLGLLGDRLADAVDPLLPALDTTVPTGARRQHRGERRHVPHRRSVHHHRHLHAGRHRHGRRRLRGAAVPDRPGTYSLTPQGLVLGILPLLRTTVAAPSSIDLLRLPLLAGAPLGLYTWLWRWPRRAR